MVIEFCGAGYRPGDFAGVFSPVSITGDWKVCAITQAETGLENKKAAPLGAAVIATLNHITGHILLTTEIFGMG